MKHILIASILILAVACTDNGSGPGPINEVDTTPTPIVIDPTPTPIQTLVCKDYEVIDEGKCVHKNSLWDANQEFCKPEGKKFNCYNPVWYGLKGCAPDSDGDLHAEGNAYFKTVEEIKNLNKPVSIKFLDGTEMSFGIGMKPTCREI